MANPFEVAMEEEMAKGPASDVPENTMATVSALKDWATGKNPTREGLQAAVGQGLSDISARKIDLVNKLQSGGQLSSSQLVGLGVLALGLLSAGAAIKGKRGVGMAGQAFNVGGKVFLDQAEENAKIENRSTIAQLNAVNAEEKDLTKLATDNALAPIKREETIGAKVEARRRMVESGTLNPNAGGTKVIMPDAKARERLEAVQEAVGQLDELEALLQQKFPVQLQKGESWLSAAARIGQGTIASEGDQKEVNAMLQGIVRSNAKSLGANPSNQDVQRIMTEITGGNVYSVPFLAKRLASMKKQAENRGRIILKTGKALNEGGGFNTDPDSLLGKDSGPIATGPRKMVTLKDGSQQAVTKDEYQTLQQLGLL